VMSSRESFKLRNKNEKLKLNLSKNVKSRSKNTLKS